TEVLQMSFPGFPFIDTDEPRWSLVALEHLDTQAARRRGEQVVPAVPEVGSELALAARLHVNDRYFCNHSRSPSQFFYSFIFTSRSAEGVRIPQYIGR